MQGERREVQLRGRALLSVTAAASERERTLRSSELWRLHFAYYRLLARTLRSGLACMSHDVAHEPCVHDDRTNHGWAL